MTSQYSKLPYPFLILLPYLKQENTLLRGSFGLWRHTERSEEVGLKDHAKEGAYSSRQPIKHHGVTAAPQIKDKSTSNTCIIHVH